MVFAFHGAPLLLFTIFGISSGLYLIESPNVCGKSCHEPLVCHRRVNRSTGWYCAPKELNFEEGEFQNSLEEYVKSVLPSSNCPEKFFHKNELFMVTVAGSFFSFMSMILGFVAFYFYVSPWFSRWWENRKVKKQVQRRAKLEKKATTAAEKLALMNSKIRGIPCGDNTSIATMNTGF